MLEKSNIKYLVTVESFCYVLNLFTYLGSMWNESSYSHGFCAILLFRF
jgi:hypothetical protein